MPTLPVTAADVTRAAETLRGAIDKTPLTYSEKLSEIYGANIYLKREDLQNVRSFKIRGAYNNIVTADPELLANGVVAASAGNHAQGVAKTCAQRRLKATIFMPVTTPQQKVNAVAHFGGAYTDIQLVGDSFDDAQAAALAFTAAQQAYFVAPFDAPTTIAGQGTVALEIFDQAAERDMPVDYLLAAVGGGGLISGLAAYTKEHTPATQLLGFEPQTAASMATAVKHGGPTTLGHPDHFVDGASVARVGDVTYAVASALVDDFYAVPEGRVAQAVLDMYTNDAIVAEPAGALPVAGLDQIKDEIQGKNVVVVVSGGNNDISRMAEMTQRAEMYANRQHYYLVAFPQRPGALKQFVNDVLGPDDDINRFEYTKKLNADSGSVMVGILLASGDDLPALTARLDQFFPQYQHLERDTALFNMLV